MNFYTEFSKAQVSPVRIVNSNHLLNCDDGLGILKNISRPEIEMKKKAIVKVFKNRRLSIVVGMNLIIVKFWDATFDFEKNLYKRY